MVQAARSAHREELIRAVEQLDHAGGSVVTVTGPRGIGKSQLIDTLAAHARDLGHRAVIVRSHEAEQHLAFAALATLLREIDAIGADRTDNDEHRSLLRAAFDGGGEAPNALALGSAVLGLIGDVVADRATFLAFDDAQWLDEPSRQAILFAVRRLRSDPVMTVFTTADPAATPSDIDRIELDGVDLATATELLSARATVTDEIARRCWTATGGNPSALVELARRLDDQHLAGIRPIPWRTALPQLVVDAYTSRLAHLDADTRTALLILAVASGSSIDAGLRAFGLDRRHLRPAIEASLISDNPRPTFTQSTCAAAVIAAETPRRVREVHATMADVVADSDEAAWHLSAAAIGNDNAAAAALAATGERARTRGIPTAAAAAFERAAELADDEPMRRSLLLEAAASWWYAARPDRIGRTLEPLLVDDVPGDDRALAALRIGAAESWLNSPRRAGRDLLDEAEVAATQHPEVAVRLLYQSAASASLAADFRTAAAAAERAISLIDANSDPVGAVIAASIRGFVSLVSGQGRADDDDDVDRLFGLAALPLDRVPDDQLDLAQFVAFGLHVAGRLDDALRMTDALRRSARSRGLVSVMAYAAGLLGEIERRRGDWAMAQRWASDASATLSIEPFSQSEFGDAVCARIWAHQGHGDVRALTEPLIEQARRRDLGFVTAVAEAALLSAAVAAGDHERASQQLDIVDRDIRAAGGLDPGVLWIDLDALDVLMALGRHRDAIRLVRERRDAAGSPSGAWSAAVADLGRCLLVRHGHLRGEPTHGAAGPGDVIKAFDAIGAHFEAARARLLLAEAELVPVDDRATVVQAAIDTFVRLGAAPWEARALRLLPATATQSAAASLSSAELRVGLTVASGCSNAEAAAELFISQRTVEAHLRSIYRKLGVRNRTEMAKELNRSIESVAGAHPTGTAPSPT